jgi:dihydrofolate reductase
MAIIGIVAIAKNLAIGREGKLPWHHSADLKFFKATTIGHAVVMGARTWRSIGRPLPDRLNVVLSRSGIIEAGPDVMQLGTPAEIVELAKVLDRDVFIIGGAKTFQAFADEIDRWIVTDVPDDVPDADTFMPSDFLEGFFETERRDLDGGLTVRFLSRKKGDNRP